MCPMTCCNEYRMIEVPTLVIFGDQSFQNKHELSEADFYTKLASSKTLPTTSQPPPAYFANAYQQALQEGASHIVVVTVSGKALRHLSFRTDGCTGVRP
jgi:fatty acid-binding protein DegV